MRNSYAEREITPVHADDFFIIMNHVDATFDYPVHYHPEYELNLVMGSSGKRIVGDSINQYSEIDLVLIGPNTYHKWTNDNEESGSHVITIQFPEDLFEEGILQRKLMAPIQELLNKSNRGIEFSMETKLQMKERIMDLCNTYSFDSVLNFLSILHDLAMSKNQKLLASSTFKSEFEVPKSRRIKKAVQYLQDNYEKDIMISEVAQMVNMSDSAFSHFFKRRTQRSFSDYLIDIRIGHSCRKLLETNHNVSEICYNCGFNNLSNFNRLFKKKKGCTPSEFREYNQMITKY
ncbi:AraC family transcriptional regulator [Rhodohalobacter sp. 614A]|uniref:AraC family transcriptional regulator n=1 Tax=Rhodohalobacter sp. 614A TaxID=2908649 RepID=UPI001F39B126|nr:AraC family transcriptional regulator [Rhodohalobacter sp. 614A]